MKKSMVFIASSLALVIGISGCDFGSGSDTVSTLTKEQAAQAVATDDFIYVTTDEVTVPAEMSGKTAYLITYNNGDPVTGDKINTGNLNTVVFESYNSETSDDNKIDRNALSCETFPLEKRVSRGANYASEPNYDNYNVGEQAMFYVTEDSITNQVPFIKKKIRSHCNVWYYEQDNGVTLTDDKFDIIASKFDSIFNIEKSIFGSNIPDKFYRNTISYNSCCRKINILVYDINQDASTNPTGGTYGYFHSKDFFERTSSNGDYVVSNSNLTECFYIDSYFLKERPVEIYSTLVHEFQHLLYFVNKWLNNDVRIESWNTEMMSMLAEEVLQSKINDNTSIYPKNRFILHKIGNFFGFTNQIWNSKNIYTFNYSNTYAFGSFLLHNYGVDYIKALVKNKGSGINLITESLPNNETFDTMFYKYGKFYIDGILPSVTYNEITLPEVNLCNSSWTATESAVRSWFSNSQGQTISEAEASDLFENYNPLIWKAGCAPGVIYPQGFYVSKLGTVGSDGSTYINLKSSNSDIYRFIYIK